MKSKDNIISVIVSIYNISCYLKKCLDSIINQKYKNLEIVLVDGMMVQQMVHQKFVMIMPHMMKE